MNEPRRIAYRLASEDDGCAAAILVTMVETPRFDVHDEDVERLFYLRQLGCLWQGEPTPQGQRVALVLRNLHGVEPAPREVLS